MCFVIAVQPLLISSRPGTFFPGTLAGGAGALKLCAALTLTKSGVTSLNTPNFLNFTLRQPFGVVAAILPWNVPLSEPDNSAS